MNGAVTAPDGFSSTGVNATTFDNTGGSISTTNSAVIIDHTGDVTLAGNVSSGSGVIDVDSGGVINGGGTLTSDTVDLLAVAGIGNLTPVNLVTPYMDAVTTNGDIDINNSIGGAVTVNSMTTGIGDITFNQTGNSTIDLVLVETNSGNVTANTGGTLTATNVQASGTLALSAGNMLIYTVGTGGAVTFTANGTINGVNAGTFSGSSVDVTATTIGLSAAPTADVSDVVMTLTAEVNGRSGDLIDGPALVSRPLDSNISAPGTVTIGPWDYLATEVDISAILASLATLSSSQQQLEDLLSATTASEFFMTPPLEIYIDMEEDDEFDEALKEDF